MGKEMGHVRVCVCVCVCVYVCVYACYGLKFLSNDFGGRKLKTLLVVVVIFNPDCVCL